MATSDFQVFAGGAGANVLSQAAYLALQARITGFQTGIAQSQQLNKVWRQSSIMSAMIAQFIVDFSGQNATDDGTIATLEANFNSAIQSANRIKVPLAGVSLFVSPTGNDANNGLTVGAPFLTLQHAANVANSNYDTQGNNITVNVAAGTYSAGATLNGQPVGGGQIQFIGTVGSSSSVHVTLGAPGTCFAASTGARMSVSWMTLSAPFGSSNPGQIPGDCLQASVGGQLLFSNLTFGLTQRAHIETGSGGQVQGGGPYTISGAATYHSVAGGGQYAFQTQAVTLIGTPAFTIFAWASSGNIFAAGASFSGAATGQKYLCDQGGSISTGAAGINFFPGNTAGNSALGYYS